MGISKYENAAAVDAALDKGVEAFGRTASGIPYDNSASGLEADNVQSAIDEIKDEFYAEITHVNTSIAGCVKAPDDEIARIGQILYVAEVGEDGKPTKWTYSEPEPPDPSDLTYAEIADIVRRGKAESVFKIGDQIITTYTDTDGNQYEMPWDIVAFREVELEDESKVPGMVIQSHYATVESIQFDAAESSSSNSDVQGYGWNRWSYSGIRQWLNSDANKGSWWTSTHTGDVAPTQLSSVNGFMKGFSSDFLSMLKPTKHETALNYVFPSGSANTYVYDTTYDVFFLPSVKEEHYQDSSKPTNWDGSGKEGTDWEYWIQRKGETPQDYGSNDPNAIRYSLADKSTAKYVWLRSANRSRSNNEFDVRVAGNMNGSISSYTSCSAPAAVIC